MALCSATLATAAGCGEEGRTSDWKRSERIAESKAEIFAYCVERLQLNEDNRRSRVIEALAVLEREYQRAPNTPFAGEDRDHVRQALAEAGRQLETCDAPLARRAESIGDRNEQN